MENEKNFEELDIQDRLENDLEFFIDFIHKRLTNEEFVWSSYNRRILKELLLAYKLSYLFLLINIPPRLGKTAIVRYFLAWTQFRDSKVYNNYYTYSDLLVNGCYTIIQKIFKIPEIAERVEVTFKREKEDFQNGIGGGLFCQTTFGQVTGFGAGRKEDDSFGGCIVIDDPHKAQDSIIKIASANKAVKSAILNRKNNSRVPIILIMQRIHKLDLTGYLLEFYKEYFKDGRALHLKMPVEKDGKTISKREYPLDQIKIEREKDPDYYWTQLMQEPQNIEGKYFKNKHFDLYTKINKEKSFATISFNPENTTDPIVFIAFKKEDKDAVILDYKEESIEADTFFTALNDFCEINGSKKVYIPKSLINPTLKQELKPLKVEELEENTNIGLNAFYAVGLLKEGKIMLKADDLTEALKEELKLYPNSKREYATKAMISVLEVLFVKGAGRIQSSL